MRLCVTVFLCFFHLLIMGNWILCILVFSNYWAMSNEDNMVSISGSVSVNEHEEPEYDAATSDNESIFIPREVFGRF